MECIREHITLQDECCAYKKQELQISLLKITYAVLKGHHNVYSIKLLHDWLAAMNYTRKLFLARNAAFSHGILILRV